MDGNSNDFTLGASTVEELLGELNKRFPSIVFCGVNYPRGEKGGPAFTLDVLSANDSTDDLHLCYLMVGHQLLAHSLDVIVPEDEDDESPN